MPRVFVAAFGLLLIPSLSLGEEAANQPAAENAAQPAPALPALVAPWTDADHYGRYASRKELVHRRAAWKAEQRAQRMAGLSWLGYSPLRPPASPVPAMGRYSGFSYVGLHYPLFGAVYQPAAPLIVGQLETTNR